MRPALWLRHINSGSKATETWSWPLISIYSWEQRTRPYESTHSTAVSSCYGSHFSGLAVLFTWMSVATNFTSDKSYGMVDTEHGTWYGYLSTMSRSTMRWDLSSGTQWLHCLPLRHRSNYPCVSISYVHLCCGLSRPVKTTQPWTEFVRSESALTTGKSVHLFRLSPHSQNLAVPSTVELIYETNLICTLFDNAITTAVM
jgi:hypothetical protein